MWRRTAGVRCLCAAPLWQHTLWPRSGPVSDARPFCICIFISTFPSLFPSAYVSLAGYWIIPCALFPSQCLNFIMCSALNTLMFYEESCEFRNLNTGDDVVQPVFMFTTAGSCKKLTLPPELRLREVAAGVGGRSRKWNDKVAAAGLFITRIRNAF